MRVIQKKISLNQFKSYMPGVIDSLIPGIETPYDFTLDNLEEIPTTNYGLFPLDIMFKNKKYSYPTLISLYRFIKDYYNMLIVSMNCGKRKYESVSEYNEHEIIQFNQNYFINKYHIPQDYDIDTYDNPIDAYFNEINGQELFEFIKINCFPRFDIPEEYINVWGCNYLYIGEIIKWRGWFRERYDLYKDIDTCLPNNDYDCCDCKEYIRRGGNDFYEKLEQFIATLRFNPNEIQDNGPYIEFPLTITTSIDDLGEMTPLTSEWEYLGNYYTTDYDNNIGSSGTVVSYDYNDWILTSNESGYIYSDKYKEGYFASEEALTEEEKEYVKEGSTRFGTNQWERRINWLKTHDANFLSELVSSGQFNYAYNKFKLVINPTPKDMAKQYDITRSQNGFIYINNTIQEIIVSDYIQYTWQSDGKTKQEHQIVGNYYLVNYSDNKNRTNPYIVINGKKYYGTFDARTSIKYESNWYFNLTEVKCVNSGEIVNISRNGKFIYYNNAYYKVDNNGNVIINTLSNNTQKEETYTVFDGYSYINNRVFLFKGTNLQMISHNSHELVNDTIDSQLGTKLSLNSATNSSKGYSVEGNKLYLLSPYTVYNVDKISGKTESRLDAFLMHETSVDDYGNILPGYINETSTSKYFAQPQEGDTLDLYYKVGSITSELELLPFKENGIDFYFGNLLESMVYYYEDYYNNKIVSYTITVNGNSFGKYTIKTNTIGGNETNNSVDKIPSITEIVDTLQELIDDYLNQKDNGNYLINEHYNVKSEILCCDFIYYYGAVLQKKYTYDGTTYKYDKYRRASLLDSTKYHDGVKFVDKCYLEKNDFPYFLDSSNSYNIKYYNIIHEVNYNTNQSYNTSVETQMANFETTISSYNYNTKKSPYEGSLTMDINNGFVALPTFREEYKIGNSSLEKVESDIYIDRGINSAFDKHLKLLEIKSLEALENYSNGGFYNLK